MDSPLTQSASGEPDDVGRGFWDGLTGAPLTDGAGSPSDIRMSWFEGLVRASGLSAEEWAAFVSARSPEEVHTWMRGEPIPVDVLAHIGRLRRIESTPTTVTLTLER